MSYALDLQSTPLKANFKPPDPGLPGVPSPQALRRAALSEPFAGTCLPHQAQVPVSPPLSPQAQACMGQSMLNVLVLFFTD